MPETKAWMKFLWVKTPSRYRRSNRGGSAGIQTQNSFDKIAHTFAEKTKQTSLPLLVQVFFLLCSVWMVCCWKRRPVPGSHPSSRRSCGGLNAASSAGDSVPPSPAKGGVESTISSWFFHKTCKENTITAANFNKVERSAYFITKTHVNTYTKQIT